MYLVVVHIDALQLQVGVSVVRTRRVDAVLIADHLPELRADLVAAQAALDVHELTHGVERKRLRSLSQGVARTANRTPLCFPLLLS